MNFFYKCRSRENRVKLIEECNNIMTKGYLQKQYLLQVVSENHKKIVDCKKTTLTSKIL